MGQIRHTVPHTSVVSPGLLLSFASQIDRRGSRVEGPDHTGAMGLCSGPHSSEYGEGLGEASPAWVPTGAGVLLQREDGIW